MGMAVGPAGGKKKGIPPGINITPLVDIVLVLLIIFMVMTPLMMKHFSFNLPEKEDKDANDSKGAGGNSSAPAALVLSIDDTGKMTLNGTVMPDLEALKAKLAQAFAARKDFSMFFDAGDKVKYGQVSEALDASREAGAKAIAFVTDRAALGQLR